MDLYQPGHIKSKPITFFSESTDLEMKKLLKGLNPALERECATLVLLRCIVLFCTVYSMLSCF